MFAGHSASSSGVIANDIPRRIASTMPFASLAAVPPPPGLEEFAPQPQNCDMYMALAHPQAQEQALLQWDQQGPQSRAEMTMLLTALLGAAPETLEPGKVQAPSSQSTCSSFSRDAVEFDLDEVEAEAPEEVIETETTLMVRNIPTMYTQEMLVRDWPLDGTYNLLYLPRASPGKKCKGFAFINFVSRVQAEAFTNKWQGVQLGGFSGSRDGGLGVSLADVQGFDANIRQFKEKRVNRVTPSKFRPLLLVKGGLVDLRDM